MRKFLTITALVLIASVSLFGWSILNNTSISEGIALTTLVTDAYATSSAISLKGYDRVHILAPYEYPFVESSTIELTLFKATGSTADYTEYSSTTAVASVTASGVLELEAVRDMDYPYIKAELLNNSSANLSTVTLGLEAQTITAAAMATSSSISFVGYSGGQVIIPYTFAAAADDALMVVTLYKATGTSADLTEVSSTTAVGTPTDNGVVTLDVDYDATYQWYKVQVEPTGQNVITDVTAVKDGPAPEMGVTVVFYGQDSRPF